MYCSDDEILFNFDKAALGFVNNIYVEFLFSIKDIDRFKNENTFQLWTQKYMHLLKQRLEGKAREFISRNRNLPTIDWFHKKIVYMISQHLREFSQMIRTT